MKALFLKIRQNLHIILPFTVIAAFYLTFGCPIRYFTGIACPGCGMSRALFALLQFDFALAYEMHPLVFLMPVAAAVYLLRRRLPKKAISALCISALVLLTAAYIVRLNGQSNVVYADFENGLIYKIYDLIN